MWTIFKVFIEFVILLLLFYILDFWLQGIRILAPRPRIKPALPTLEGEVLTSGPPAKSQSVKVKSVSWSVVSNSLRSHGL